MKKPLTILFLFLFISPCFAQWQLVDNFQQWTGGEKFEHATGDGWTASSSCGQFWMMTDPLDVSNVALFLYNAPYCSAPSNIWAIKELPDGGIFPGETGTLYLRYMQSGPSNMFYWGTSDRPLELDEITGQQMVPGWWSDFNALVRIDDGGTFGHRDGTDYVTTTPAISIEDNNWYEFWMVVSNNFDQTDDQWTSTGVCTIYLKGPDDINPVLLKVGMNPPKDSALFRRSPLDDDGNPQAVILYMLASGITSIEQGRQNSGDPFLVDDLYFSHGVNLSNPTDNSTSCCWGYCADGNGDVDTGELLGWLNIYQAPYLWSYSLEGWLYMEEPSIDATGAWAYFYK